MHELQKARTKLQGEVFSYQFSVARLAGIWGQGQEDRFTAKDAKSAKRRKQTTDDTDDADEYGSRKEGHWPLVPKLLFGSALSGNSVSRMQEKITAKGAKNAKKRKQPRMTPMPRMKEKFLTTKQRPIFPEALICIQPVRLAVLSPGQAGLAGAALGSGSK